MGVSSISSSSTIALDFANARQLLTAAQTPSTPRENANDLAAKDQDVSATQPSEASAQSGKSTQLSDAEAAQLAKLQARDRQVRQHEFAHLAASGGLATSGASFTYQKGPDGVNYAVGGEVSIDTSPGRTPEETVSRAQQIQTAALAPADPSGQDRAVAAQARQMESNARAQMALSTSSDAPKTETSASAPAPKPDEASSQTQEAAKVEQAAKLEQAAQTRQQVQQAYELNVLSSRIRTFA